MLLMKLTVIRLNILLALIAFHVHGFDSRHTYAPRTMEMKLRVVVNNILS